MLSYIGWALAALLTILVILLVCPVRYRCEVGNQGGFLDILLLGGLYKKHIHFSDKTDGGGEAEDTAEKADTAGPQADTERAAGPVKTETTEKTPVVQESPVRTASVSEDLPGETKQTGSVAESSQEHTEKSAGSAQEEKMEGREEAAETGDETAVSRGKEGAQGKETTPQHPSSAKVLLYAWKNGTIHLALATLKQLYRHAKPQEFLITGTAGLGDPMETGLAAGLAYAALPGTIRIDWNYTESICQVTAKAKGRIVPVYLLWIGGRFLVTRQVRETIHFRKTGTASVSAEKIRN